MTAIPSQSVPVVTPIGESEALQLTASVLGVMPRSAARQSRGESGNATFRVDLADGKSVCLKMSSRAKLFTYTQKNLDVLRALGLPVSKVLANGATRGGGSYIFLDWLTGNDLVTELPAMSQPQMMQLASQWVRMQRLVGRLPPAKGYGWAPIGRSGSLAQWTQVFGAPAAGGVGDDASVLGKLRGALRQLRGELEPYFQTVRPICFLDDLTLKNVLVRQGQFSGVIDVDFVCYGDPLLALGATLAAIVAEVSSSGDFYGRELRRFWNPTALEQKALHFYAALWATGLLDLSDARAHPARVAALAEAAAVWLNQSI